MSLSSRRAWIEIYTQLMLQVSFHRRSPHGERGLKYKVYQDCVSTPCRSPHGERGLKLLMQHLMLRL